MKKVLLFGALVVLAACNSNQPAASTDTKAATDTTATIAAPVVAEIKSPYPVAYSSKFAMDDPKNAETLLSIWKDWDNGDLSAGKDKFADSLTLNLNDGTVLHGGRDSILNVMQKFRSSFAKAVSNVSAVMAVKSTDKNENWALIWGDETDTDKKGKATTFSLQETWRFNKDGKADLVFQTMAKSPKK